MNIHRTTRISIKIIASLVSLVMLAQQVSFASGEFDLLAPNLRMKTREFREHFTAANLCKTIEREGKVNESTYLDDIFDLIASAKDKHPGIRPSRLLYEITIEIPGENMIVRYFDPRHAPALTPYSDISSLKTKVFSKILHRQIIHRVHAISSGEALEEAPVKKETREAATIDEDEVENRIVSSCLLFLETRGINILEANFSRLAQQASINQANQDIIINAIRKAGKKYPILTDANLRIALMSIPKGLRDILLKLIVKATRTKTDMSKVKVFIMAAGSGTRSWPKSSTHKPKQVVKSFLPTGRSSLEETIYRLTHNGFINPKQIYINVTEPIRGAILQQAAGMGIPEENILEEPMLGGLTHIYGEAKSRRSSV